MAEVVKRSYRPRRLVVNSWYDTHSSSSKCDRFFREADKVEHYFLDW